MQIKMIIEPLLILCKIKNSISENESSVSKLLIKRIGAILIINNIKLNDFNVITKWSLHWIYIQNKVYKSKKYDHKYVII